MMTGLFDGKKRVWFPEIKDFSDPQDVLRDTPGYKLSMGDWFWFNPFAFRFVMVGIPVQLCIMFGIVSAIGLLKGWVFLAAIGIIAFLLSGYKGVDVLKKRVMWKECRMNFYDQHLREYDAKEEVK